MARKRSKSSNGEGMSVTVYFDRYDRREGAALAMAQLLATKHGRRKDAIVSFLAAMYDHYERTGEIMTATEIANTLSGNHLDQAFAQAAYQQNMIGGGPKPVVAKTPPPPVFDDDDTIELNLQAAKTSGRIANQNFINSLLNL